MRQFAIILLALAVASYIGWRNRINLASRETARLAKLEALLAEHNAEQAEPMWPSITPSPQLIDKHGGQPYEEGDDYIYWPN